MNRETQRQITRLEKTRNLILANSDSYRQTSLSYCIIAFAFNVQKRQKNFVPDFDYNVYETGAYLGFDEEDTMNIYLSKWKKLGFTKKGKKTAKTAAEFLNFLIEKKRAGEEKFQTAIDN